MLEFESETLDRAGKILSKKGWNPSEIKRNWHVTLGKRGTLTKFQISQMIKVLRNAKWNWIAVKREKKPPNKAVWYHQVPAYDLKF